MNKKMILCLVLCFLLGCTAAGMAETNGKVQPEPSALLVNLVGGGTLTARLSGYGFGDTVDTFTMNFWIVEPVVYASAQVEGLTAGSVIMANFAEYEAVEIQKDGDSIIVKAKEDWQEPLKLSPAADGKGYNAETEGKVLMQDVYQIECSVSPAFEYKAEDGTVLDPEAFMKKISEGELNLDECFLEVSFDENARILKIEKK